MIAYDPLVMDKKRVQMTAQEIWKVTGFRFTYIWTTHVMGLLFTQSIQGERPPATQKWT
jgi:hypothetical protein